VAKKSQNAINIISWISVISIAIGTFALVVVLSAFNGLESLVESLFESFDSDIRIEAKEGKYFAEKELPLASIQELEGIVDYTRVLEEVCIVGYKSQKTIATLKGVDSSFLSMSRLEDVLIDGDLVLKKNGINFAISGYGIASQLGLYLNRSSSNLTVYAPKREIISTINPLNSFYRKMIAPAGVFYISPEYDNKYMLTPLSFVQDLLDLKGQVSSVEIAFEEGVNLDKAKQQVERIVGENYTVTNRYEFNEIIYKTNKTEKWVTFLILIFILTIAAFNILSSLSMLILEKKKDIQTLKSLGAKNSTIRRIFFLEGMLINLSGALSGLFLGVVVCLLQQHLGLLRLEGGIVEYYPVELNPVELIYILFAVLLIGFLTSWFPVRNLTKVS
jgi:lipoprotein-releasing system permease protein